MNINGLINSPCSKKSVFRAVFRVLLGLMLMWAGFSHLTIARTEFVAQVPKWLTINEDLVVVLSGIVEITLGFSLVFLYRFKIIVGLVAGLFFIAIFPGNISQYTNHINAFGLDTDKARLIRLFFQPLLVAWAVWSTGAWCYLMNKNKNN